MVNMPGTQLHGRHGVFKETVYHTELGINNKAINQLTSKLILLGYSHT
jgi:hypothetical protein